MRIAATGLVLVLFAACGDDPAPQPGISSVTITPSRLRATETATMTVAVIDFELDYGDAHMHALRAAHGDEPHETVAAGHIHVYLDSVDVNPLVQTGRPTFPVLIPGGTTPGDHRLIVRLHGADHTILVPEVRSEVSLTVDP